MKNTLILPLALTACLTLGGTFAHARGIRVNKAAVQREMCKAELKTRARMLEELSAVNFPARVQPALDYLQAKNGLISRFQNKNMTETEQEAVTLYGRGDFYGAYAKLDFDMQAVLYGLEELRRYVTNLSLNAFRWPNEPRAEDETRLAFLRETLRRQQVIQNIAANWEETAARDYALRYLQEMDGLLNRRSIRRLTKRDLNALQQYGDGDIQAAYQTLGFEWQKVINALESLELYALAVRRAGQAAQDERELFAWPVITIEWKTKKRK